LERPTSKFKKKQSDRNNRRRGDRPRRSGSPSDPDPSDDSGGSTNNFHYKQQDKFVKITTTEDIVIRYSKRVLRGTRSKVDLFRKAMAEAIAKNIIENILKKTETFDPKYNKPGKTPEQIRFEYFKNVENSKRNFTRQSE
jgi:hypothetical protein